MERNVNVIKDWSSSADGSFPFFEVEDAIETAPEEDTEGATQDGVEMDKTF